MPGGPGVEVRSPNIQGFKSAVPEVRPVSRLVGLEKDSQAHWWWRCEAAGRRVESSHTLTGTQYTRCLEEKPQGLDLGSATFRLCVFPSLSLGFLI